MDENTSFLKESVQKDSHNWSFMLTLTVACIIFGALVFSVIYATS